MEATIQMAPGRDVSSSLGTLTKRALDPLYYPRKGEPMPTNLRALYTEVEKEFERHPDWPQN